MDRLLLAADKLLSILPFNGNKTVLSMGMKFLLPCLVSHFPILIPLAPMIDILADAGIAIGAAHKIIKANR